MTSVAQSDDITPSEQAALEALAEKLQRGESWKPESKGDQCAGKAAADPWATVAPRDDQKKRCEVLTLLTAAGPVTVWTYNRQLKTKLIKPGISTQAEAEAVPYSERLVQPGDLVAIEFAGNLPHPEKEGQTYNRFIVEISRPVSVPEEDVTDGDDIPY